MPRIYRKLSEKEKKKISDGLKKVGFLPTVSKKFIKNGEKTRFKKGHSGWLGRKHTEETKKKLSELHMGKIPWNKGITGYKTKPCSEENKKRLSELFLGRPSPLRGKKRKPFSEEHKKNISLSKHGRWKGEENPHFKDWITPKNLLQRSSRAMDKWRLKVFERDNYTCQACEQVGGHLCGDHELPFAFYPDLRFEVLNGRTFCKGCHEKLLTFRRQTNDIYGGSTPEEVFLIKN